MPETERYGVSFRGKVRLAPAVDLFAEFSYRNIFTVQQLAPAPIEGDVEGIAVPAANPFNPFGTDVVFRYRVTEAGARRRRNRDGCLSRARWLENLHLPGRWELEAAVLYSETSSEDTTFNNLSRPACSPRWLIPIPATAFNVFGAGDNMNNPATIRSLRVTTAREGDVSTVFGGCKDHRTVVHAARR